MNCDICKREHAPTPDNFHLVLHPNQKELMECAEQHHIAYIISQYVNEKL